MNKAGLRVCKMDDVSPYLTQIDRADADADFYKDVSSNKGHLYAVCYDGEVVGVSSIIDDADAYVYVYIFPQHRCKGYGYLAVGASEQLLQSTPLESITTAYDSNNAVAEKLAKKCDFLLKHESLVMEYPGKKFGIPELPIRKHRDEDFLEAYTLSAEAFHIMRLETGHDPNSVPYPADENARQECLRTADERYIYALGDKIIGCAHIDGAEIDNIAIGIAYQGNGYGRKFMKYLTNEILAQGIGKPFLYCLASNKKALQLYQSLGYVEIFRNAYAVKKSKKAVVE